MGFYGQVVYEFTKLFSSLKITPYSNSETIMNTAGAASARIRPSEQWDELEFTPGNRWIQLSGDETNKKITIGHGGPGTAVSEKHIIGFSALDEGETPSNPTALSYGQCIKTTTGEYDSAGHMVSKDTQYFTLPTSVGEQEFDALTNDKNYAFTYLLNGKRTSPEDEYEEGDYWIDENGNEVLKGIDAINYLDSVGYVHTNTLDTAMANYLNNDEHKYVQDKVTGKLTDLYSASTIQSATPGTYTITSAIGPIEGADGLQSIITNITGTQGCSNIVQGIAELAEVVKTYQSAAQMAIDAYEGLKARLQVLENQHSE